MSHDRRPSYNIRSWIQCMSCVWQLDGVGFNRGWWRASREKWGIDWVDNPDEEEVQRMESDRWSIDPSSLSYRSISSSRGVASPAMDMGVLSIIGLGDGRGVILWAFFRPSASFSFNHCSAILPQSTADALLLLLLLALWGRENRGGGVLVWRVVYYCLAYETMKIVGLAPSRGRKVPVWPIAQWTSETQRCCERVNVCFNCKLSSLDF